MAGLTRPIAEETPLEETLAAVTATAVSLIAGIDYADVMLVDHGEFESIAPTDPLVSDLDALQLRLQQGPCLQAAVGEEVIRCPDLSHDERWPQFATMAVQAGVHSMLSFRLYTHRTGSGALNLLGRTAHPFGHEDLLVGAMLATHAATAVLAVNKQRQFESALASRDVIGQAKGMLMERFNINAVRAFEMMTKLSQDTNTPLRVIARRITEVR
ncbi:ANTAR domain protein [Mycobacterium sp. ITM-2017-0098]|nr:ANTAR domain protein [Mycobacterium sp. ITM-2017-0098]